MVAEQDTPDTDKLLRWSQ